jgi:hypothetical protein
LREDHLRSGKTSQDAGSARPGLTDAEHVFAGPTYTIRDGRFVYPEPEGRFITVGFLRGRMVMIAWTPIAGVRIDDGRHVISMRKANDREQARYRNRFEES